MTAVGTSLPLTPVENVNVRDDGCYKAISAEPWLALPAHPALRPGSFVEVVYRLSLWDEPVRPVFRFIGFAGTIEDHIAPAPVGGRASWIARVPEGSTALQVSPTCRPGPFGFEVEAIRRRRLPGLLLRTARWAPRPTRSAVLTRLIGWRPESESNFRWALGSRPIEQYSQWRRQTARSADLNGLERPRFDWTAGPSFEVILFGANALARTLASLSGQIYGKRTVRLVPSHPTAARPTIALDEQAGTQGQAEFVLALRGGETLRPDALAIVAEAAQRAPEAVLFYGDEEDGAGIRPDFKPGWNPSLFRSRGTLGRAVFIARSLWDTFAAPEQVAFIETGTLPVSRIERLPARAVRAIPRILLSGDPLAAQPDATVDAPRTGPVREATIVIPTRDRADLLERCLQSLERGSPTIAREIVVVDNGSTDPAALALLERAGSKPGVTVLRRPGPFNYAAMCNEAAEVGTAPILVFLNNDTAVRSDDWLDRLLAHAAEPDVGAVGAKLVLPDGRIQHMGVVLGMGGLAGHFGAFQPPDAPGWAGQHGAVHEVAAVTGACLAVERRKFDAVGGFDADHLPVELNDIDLCLKLAARGWRARVDPAVVLLHEESASRGGATFRRLALYADQRAAFLARWRTLIRDDPYFHPALSLYNVDLALA